MKEYLIGLFKVWLKVTRCSKLFGRGFHVPEGHKGLPVCRDCSWPLKGEIYALRFVDAVHDIYVMWTENGRKVYPRDIKRMPHRV